MTQAVLAAGSGHGSGPSHRRARRRPARARARDLDRAAAAARRGRRASLLMAASSGWLAREMLRDPSSRRSPSSCMRRCSCSGWRNRDPVVRQRCEGLPDARLRQHRHRRLEPCADHGAVPAVWASSADCLRWRCLPLVELDDRAGCSPGVTTGGRAPAARTGFDGREVRSAVAFVPMAVITAVGYAAAAACWSATASSATRGWRRRPPAGRRCGSRTCTSASRAAVFAMYFFPRFSEITRRGRALREVRRGL